MGGIAYFEAVVDGSRVDSPDNGVEMLSFLYPRMYVCLSLCLSAFLSLFLLSLRCGFAVLKKDDQEKCEGERR